MSPCWGVSPPQMWPADSMLVTPSSWARLVKLLRNTGCASAPRVSYRNLAGFGATSSTLTLDGCAMRSFTSCQHCVEFAAVPCGASVRYVEPHGALYNTIVHHQAQARQLSRRLTLSAPPRVPMAILGLSPWPR